MLAAYIASRAIRTLLLRPHRLMSWLYLANVPQKVPLESNIDQLRGPQRQVLRPGRGS
jgi:hypothetical protein